MPLSPLERSIRRSRAYQTLQHWRYSLRDHEYRRRDAIAKSDHRRFLLRDGGKGLAAYLPQRTSQKTALIVSQMYLPFTPIEALMIKSFNLAGFRTVVMGNRRYDYLRYFYLVGSKSIYDISDFDPVVDTNWLSETLRKLTSLEAWLDLTYEGVHVGRFVIATALRQKRVGRLDFADPDTMDRMRELLEFSLYTVVGSKHALDEVKPDCVLMMDRGYSGHGEFFDHAINRGIDAITWHLGHRSNRLLIKRYNALNHRQHPFSPSEESWRRLREMEWKPEYAQQVRSEIFNSYETQDWFSVTGTQFDKPILTKETARQMLGLSGDRKIAVIFPHILWDGSFFYGTDLFEDYTHWFEETLRAAARNPRIQWIIKLHPSHLVKASQKNTTERPAELSVIEQSIGKLPEHIKLVYPETKISTYSLFEIADYVITVRGTVGIEAALLGVPVLTAGTGRYDRRGFTLDSSSREEYLERLASLETQPRMTPDQIELAERYAFGVFLCRPLVLESASLEYARDAIATPRLTIHCQTAEQWRSAEDLARLGDWLSDGNREDMLRLPGEASR